MEVGIINELASKIEERFKITVPRNGNCFSVKINGNSTIIITSSEVSGSLFFCAQIGSILKNQGADSLRQLLNANLKYRNFKHTRANLPRGTVFWE
jgi:hypothetical protein